MPAHPPPSTPTRSPKSSDISCCSFSFWSSWTAPGVNVSGATGDGVIMLIFFGDLKFFQTMQKYINNPHFCRITGIFTFHKQTESMDIASFSLDLFKYILAGCAVAGAANWMFWTKYNSNAFKLKLLAARREEIGRASCRERVGQYV